MQVSRSPIARWMSAATTVESTPPESAADHALAGRPARGCAAPAVDEVLHRPVGLRAADPQHEVARGSRVRRRVGDLGMELEAVDRPLAVAEGGVAASCRWWRASRGPAPRRVDAVAVAHPDAGRAAADGEQRVDAHDARRRPGRTPCASARADLAAERQVEDVHAVADAEHGRRPSPSSSRTSGRGIGASSA